MTKTLKSAPRSTDNQFQGAPLERAALPLSGALAAPDHPAACRANLDNPTKLLQQGNEFTEERPSSLTSRLGFIAMKKPLHWLKSWSLI